MQLTADTFHEIVQSLRSDGGTAGGGKENRKKPRVGISGRTIIMVPAKSGAKQFPANVKDLSGEGVGLVIAEPLLAAGDEFVMLLPAGVRQGRRAVVYAVRRTSPLGPNQFAVGGRLVREVQMETPPAAAQAKPSPAAARPATAPVAEKGTITQGLSDEMLKGADADTVSELEARLRKLTA